MDRARLRIFPSLVASVAAKIYAAPSNLEGFLGLWLIFERVKDNKASAIRPIKITAK